MEIREIVTAEENGQYVELAKKHFKHFDKINCPYDEFVLGAFNPEFIGYMRNVIMPETLEIANAGAMLERQGIFTSLAKETLKRAEEYDVRRVTSKVVNPRMLKGLGFETVKMTDWGYLMEYNL